MDMGASSFLWQAAGALVVYAIGHIAGWLHHKSATKK